MDDLPDLKDLLGAPSKKEKKGDFNSTTSVECRNCGESFLLKRKWQAFCSDICRTGFHRREMLTAKDRQIEDLEKEVQRLEAENARLRNQLGL